MLCQLLHFSTQFTWADFSGALKNSHSSRLSYYSVPNGWEKNFRLFDLLSLRKKWCQQSDLEDDRKFLWENLVLLLVIKGPEHERHCAGTSSPFFPTARARKEWKQHSDGDGPSPNNVCEQQQNRQDKENAGWIANREKQKATTIQRKESLIKLCPRASKPPPEGRGGSRQPQTRCPVRNSKTEPVGQKTRRNVLQGQRATRTDPALRTSLQL